MTARALDVGRKRRTIPPALRRALRARDRCCRFPGCTHRRWLDAHHIEHWMHGGDTRLDNLVHLCGWHHHLVHEGGFGLEVQPDGAIVFRTPAGVALEPWGTRRSPVLEPAAALQATHQRAGLVIDAQTGHCGWDGRPVDYGACAAVAMPG